MPVGLGISVRHVPRQPLILLGRVNAPKSHDAPVHDDIRSDPWTTAHHLGRGISLVTHFRGTDTQIRNLGQKTQRLTAAKRII